MTYQTMDRSANEALLEMGLSFKLFSIDHVQNRAHIWALSFSDRRGTLRDVEIDLDDHKTDVGTMKSDDLITVDAEILGGTPVFKGDHTLRRLRMAIFCWPTAVSTKLAAYAFVRALA